ncbi:helix-turn-helix domain-containing protein [Verrucomicrobiota bacterium]
MKSQKNRPAHRKRLGDTIRAYRTDLGLSQERLAELVDCHRNYIGKVERGEQNITIDMLTRVAKALKCSVTALTGGAKL